MEIKIKGKGKDTLSKRDFLASGGEGSVYAKKGIAYKVYNDKKKMIPVGKINELSSLSDKNIIKPLDVIMDAKGQPIGYTMRHIKDTVALCSMFPKAFKDKRNMTPQQIFDLVDAMRKTTHHIHDENVLIVDCNEMNFLVSNDLKNVHFIDVDSYQTSNFPATALMESVRDRHMKPGKFNEGTDWFSWAVVTFQMFMGIHPYKGKHASLKGFDARMDKNVSIFSDDVSVPKIVPSFDILPPAYREWYEAVFQDGKRCEPPEDASVVLNIISKIAKITGSDKLIIDEIGDYNRIGNIINVMFHFGKRVVHCQGGLFVDGDKYDKVTVDHKIAFTETMNHVITAKAENGKLRLKNISTGKDLPNQVSTEKLMSYEGRLFSLYNGAVSEIGFMEMPTSTLPTPKLVANIMPQSSTMFDGVVVQEILEARDFSMFPSKGRHCQVRIKELESKKVIDARYDRGVLMIISSDKSGKYSRFVIRFNPKHTEYDIREEEDITPQGLNFIVLDTKNVAHINEDENLVIFKSEKGDKRATVIDDKSIRSDMRLYRWDSQATFAVGSKLYRIKMK